MAEAKQVHLRDLDGKLRYNILLDDGGPFLPFGGSHPYGGLARTTIKKEQWQICDGWLTYEDMESERLGQGKTQP